MVLGCEGIGFGGRGTCMLLCGAVEWWGDMWRVWQHEASSLACAMRRGQAAAWPRIWLCQWLWQLLVGIAGQRCCSDMAAPVASLQWAVLPHAANAHLAKVSIRVCLGGALGQKDAACCLLQ